MPLRLRACARGDDRARARQLLTETLAMAQRFGMDEQIRRWLAKTPSADEPTSRPMRREVAVRGAAASGARRTRRASLGRGGLR